MKAVLNPAELALRCRVSQFGGEQSVGVSIHNLTTVYQVNAQ